jgi:hypothetical protein
LHPTGKLLPYAPPQRGGEYDPAQECAGYFLPKTNWYRIKLLINPIGEKMAGKFEVKSTKNGQFMFNLKASNGEIILTSEMYKTKKGLKNGIKSVKTNAKIAAHYKVMTAKNKEPYFVLLAGNNQVIGKSEMYSSQNALENGIDSVKKNAPDAKVEDQTKK